jgi:Leucine-rich repeat (LRR) protein
MGRNYPVKNAIGTLLSNNYITAITPSIGALDPTFNKATLNYTIALNNDVNNISLAAFPEELGAEVRINSIKKKYGESSGDIPISEGSNPQTITAISETGVERRYTVTVNRLENLVNLLSYLNASETIGHSLSGFCWVLLPAISTDKYAMSKYGCFQIEASRTFTNTPRVTLTFDDATTLTLAATGYTMEADTWVSLAFSHDGLTGVTNIYVNGEKINTVTTENKIGVNLKQNTEPYMLGTKKYEAATTFYTVRNGQLYNFVLTDTQIATMHNLALRDTRVDSFVPDAAVVNNIVRVTGFNFMPDATAKFNAISSPKVTYIDHFTLDIQVPPTVEDLSLIEVTTSGNVATSSNYFRKVYPPIIPSISSINPVAGVPGDTITIIGNNFNEDITLNRVTFNNVVAEVVTCATNQLTVSVPEGATTGFITVENTSVFPVGGSCVSMFEFPILQANTDILALIDATAEGGTCTLPAGAYLFTAEKVIAKNIKIVGAGQRETFLVLNNNSGYLLRQTVSDYFEVAGITFMSRYNIPNNSNVPIRVNGATNSFRIHHCDFIFGGGHGMYLYGTIYGVVDHCYFYNTGGSPIVAYDGDYGDTAWENADPLGTEKALYAEDNIFAGYGEPASCIDCNNGYRIVFRYNTVTEMGYNYPLLTTHGNYEVSRSTYSIEIYENTFITDHVYYGLYIRGGRGVIFNNQILGDATLPICLTDYRSFYTKAQFRSMYPSRNLYPHWTELADEVQWIEDNPTDAPGYNPLTDYCDNVYPSPDQINNLYIWNNTRNGVLMNDAGTSTNPYYVRDRGRDRTTIQRDRDYFLTEMPDYVPYTYPHPLTAA